MTFPWTSAPGPFGLPGTDSTDAATTGPLTGTAGNHGSMSPWVVRNTFIAWGADFKRGTTVRTPAGNVDLAPTLLALMGLDRAVDLERFDGRPLREAFRGGPDEEQIPVDVRTYFVGTPDGGYRAAIQATQLDRFRYVDKSWRMHWGRQVHPRRLDAPRKHRDPQRVAEEVLDGLITAEEARRDYAVVVDGEGRVDGGATERTRDGGWMPAALRAERMHGFSAAALI
jgi:arylsulfatase A-like enzyme